jgi:hypothetical protein
MPASGYLSCSDSAPAKITQAERVLIALTFVDDGGEIGSVEGSRNLLAAVIP